MKDARFVVMGLPASGKTTFLAALWHLISAGEADCRLRLDRYEGDLAYLNRIAEAWRNFTPVPRTSQVGDVDVTISLRDHVSGIGGTAFFPDLAGETFDTQVEGRRCRPGFVDGVSADDGVLFFISADVREDDLSVVELNARLPAGAAQRQPQPPDGEAALPQPLKEWEPRFVPSQVRIVQLLSDLMRPPFAQRQRRLAVVISAWDLAKAVGLDPRTWLANRMPLVEQFLRTNEASFDVELYGVSAQGVSLADEAAVDAAAKLTPSRRIEIVGPESGGHDLTLPLVWLMAGG